MLLTLSTTTDRSADLGFVLAKHPDRVTDFSVSGGVAHVFYPEVSDERCTVAFVVDIDPIALVKGRSNFALGQYVNDRPYATSSFLAVALAKVFSSALKGQCKARPDLVDVTWPLEVHLPTVSVDGGVELVRRFFEPLGWQVQARPIPLDDTQPDWGDSTYVDLTLRGTHRVADALRHLYVLLPVMDHHKHYWIDAQETDKLLRAAADWLPGHPEADLITRRYLKHQRTLVDVARKALGAEEILAADGATAHSGAEAGDNVAADADRTPLNVLRRRWVADALISRRCARVVDLGCGSGKLLAELLSRQGIEQVVGLDVAAAALDRAALYLNLDEMSDRQRQRVRLKQSSLTYVDPDLADADAVVLMEVLEHVDVERHPTLERHVFEVAAPRVVIVTTPNVEYNARYGLAPGEMRHRDHRFEWTRAEFDRWADRVARAHGYDVELHPIGDVDPELGAPTQAAVFTRQEAA